MSQCSENSGKDVFVSPFNFCDVFFLFFRFFSPALDKLEKFKTGHFRRL